MSDGPNSSENENPPIRTLTNGLVDSHFKALKHGRLPPNKRVRPRVFIEAELQYTVGKINQMCLPKTTKIPRKKKQVRFL